MLGYFPSGEFNLFNSAARACSLAFASLILLSFSASALIRSCSFFLLVSSNCFSNLANLASRVVLSFLTLANLDNNSLFVFSKEVVLFIARSFFLLDSLILLFIFLTSSFKESSLTLYFSNSSVCFLTSITLCSSSSISFQLMSLIIQ